MMNKRFFSIMLAAMLVVGTPIQVLATPDDSQLNENRQKYAEIENKIAEIEIKIYDLNTTMEPLQSAIDKNLGEIENINTEIENISKDISEYQKEIEELDAVLGERVKAMYTTGNLEFSYLTFIIESDSTSDLFSRLQVVGKIIGKDKQAIENVTAKRKELDDKVDTLNTRKSDLNKLNEEVKTGMSDIEESIKQQETLAKEAEEERGKFDSNYLAESERRTVETQFAVINDSNSSAGQIQNAMDTLKAIKENQLKSPIVKAEVDTMIAKGKEAYAKKLSSVGLGNATGKAADLLLEAYKHLGKPYKWAATGPSSFDCSGFTQYVYKHGVGLEITRSTYSQINVGTPVSQANLQPGDLVFPHAGHVGIYVGNGQMIHAPQTGDVIKVGPVYRFYAARRIL